MIKNKGWCENKKQRELRFSKKAMAYRHLMHINAQLNSLNTQQRELRFSKKAMAYRHLMHINAQLNSFNTQGNKAAALSCSFYAIQKLWNSRRFIKMANQENFTTGNISELKQIIEKLTNTVTKQNLVIQNLTDRLEKLENNQITSENNIYQLEND